MVELHSNFTVDGSKRVTHRAMPRHNE